jgi:hypothetical protein
MPCIHNAHYTACRKESYSDAKDFILRAVTQVNVSVGVYQLYWVYLQDAQAFKCHSAVSSAAQASGLAQYMHTSACMN